MCLCNENDIQQKGLGLSSVLFRALNQVRVEKPLTRNTEVPNLNSESMWMPTNLKNVKTSFVNPPH